MWKFIGLENWFCVFFFPTAVFSKRSFVGKTISIRYSKNATTETYIYIFLNYNNKRDFVEKNLHRQDF